MAEAYSWADVVICRSGALTVCEIAAVGAAAIFVPFQHKDRQQYLNAKYLADVGAAKIVEQVDLTPDILVNYLKISHVKIYCNGNQSKRNGDTIISTTSCRCNH